MSLLVTLAIDQRGWCFDNIATVLQQRLSDHFSFHIASHQQIPGGRADIVVNLWWGSTCRLRSYMDATGHMACVYDGLSWYVDETARHQFLLTLRNAHIVGCCNKRFAKEVKDTYADEAPPIMLIEDGVDTRRFTPQPFPKRVVFGWAGNSSRMTPGGPKDQKGVRLIRQALAATGCRANILDVGTGRSIPHAKMPGFYGDTSVGLVCSYVEGTPNPLLEFMACGRPVIATRSDRSPHGPGLAEDLLKDGVNGWLVDRTPEAIAEAMKLAAATPPARLKQMGEAARAAVEFYDWDRKVVDWKLAIMAAYDLGKKNPRTIDRAPQPQTSVAANGVVLSGHSKWEVVEMGGKFAPHHKMNQAIQSIDPQTPGRPRVWILSGYRFFSRTWKIIRWLTDRYRFEVYPVDMLGRECLPDELPDLCWSLYPYNDGRMGVMLKRKGVPFLLSGRGAFWNVNDMVTRHALESWKSASAIAVLSRKFRGLVVARYPELEGRAMPCIPNGVEPPGEIEPLPLRGNVPRVVLVSNFTFDTKWRPAVEAITALESAGVANSYHLVGKRNSENVGRKWDKEIYYHGFVQNPLRFIKSADLLVYASDEDVQPSVIMEARALGVPVLCGVSPNSCAHEFVKKGRSGLLFHDEEELVSMARHMLSAHGEMADMSKWCEQHQAEISWNTCAELHDTLLKGLLR